ncbi:YicC family protein [bacterium]|nr:YicC family protein [bacterium]MDD5918023.1 YicC family protein [bacterium]
MISSMTGFGRATVASDGREITIELKSVNHRYLDLAFRMPRHIGFIEDVLRQLLSEQLSRGHVDIYVNYRNTRMDARTVVIDEALMGAYLTAARKAAAQYELKDDISLSTAMRFPDVTDVIEAEEDRDAVAALAREAALRAVTALKRMRAGEGERLCNDLLNRVTTVESIAAKIDTRAPFVVEEYRTKLSERIESMLGGVEVDRTRLATEVALFADKASINEELVRLASHVTEMRKVLGSDEAAGRRLDFVVQEMNREFNTIGSKANDAEITNLVIAGKGEIEKIREQVQNIE